MSPLCASGEKSLLSRSSSRLGAERNRERTSWEAHDFARRLRIDQPGGSRSGVVVAVDEAGLQQRVALGS